MTPKEKAKQLTEFFQDALTVEECVKIAVDEIMIAINWHEFEVPNEEFNYWYQVKLEIKRL